MSQAPRSISQFLNNRKHPFRRLLIGNLLLLALLSLCPNAQGGGKPRILTETVRHSADCIWSEEKRKSVYSEFRERMHEECKKSFPKDLERKTIGIGEFIKLRLASGPPEIIGDPAEAKWKIIGGSDWAELIGTRDATDSTIVIEQMPFLGAKVLEGPPGRIVTVQVTTTTSFTAEVEILIKQPSGVLVSRHAGPPPNADAEVPGTAQRPDNYRPLSVTGAWTKLIVIPMPSDVNFGGDMSGGVWIIERDVSSPPVAGTYTPQQGSIYVTSDTTHNPNPKYVQVQGDFAAFGDEILTNRGVRPLVQEDHTCKWTCEWRWLDGYAARVYNTAKPTPTGYPGSVIFNPRVIQNFETKKATRLVGSNSVETNRTTISKFNSSVTRDAGFLTQIRDTEKNWKPTPPKKEETP